MADFDPADYVLSVFKEKCRLAGGVKAGLGLRLQLIQYGASNEERLACDEAISKLVEDGLLVGNESGNRLIITEDGVAALSD